MGQESARTAIVQKDQANLVNGTPDDTKLVNNKPVNELETNHELELKKTIANAIGGIHARTIKDRSKQVTNGISFAAADKGKIYANMITQDLLDRMNLGSMKEVQQSTEKRTILIEKIRITHELLADFFDSEKNPFLDKIAGKEQLAREFFHLVTDPGYVLETVIGLGGSEDELNVRLASSYPPAVLQVIRIFKEKNDQLKSGVAAELVKAQQDIEARFPESNQEQKNKMMQVFIAKNIAPKYPNLNWQDRDQSGLPRHFMGIPRVKMLNAWSAAAEINGMDSDLLSANARAIFDLYGQYTHEFFPDVEEYTTFSIPTMNQFVDTGVYNEVHDFLKEVVMNDNYADEKVQQEFRAEILPMMQRAWKHNASSSNTEDFSQVSAEEKQQYLEGALAYIVCHVVEAGFNNLQHVSDLNTCSPKAIIKFGGSGEVKFNKFQAAIVQHFQHPEVTKLNTSGNNDIPEPIFATIKTGGNPPPYYDIKNYGDRTRSDITIAEIKAKITGIRLQNLQNHQQVSSDEVNAGVAQEVFEYYKQVDPKGKLVQDITLQEKVGVSFPQYVDFISKWQPRQNYYAAVNTSK